MDKRVFLCGLSERNEGLFWTVWSKIPDDDKEAIEYRYRLLDVYEDKDLVRNGKPHLGTCGWYTRGFGVDNDNCKITLNIDSLSDEDAKFVIAHELGHAIVHGYYDDGVTEDEKELEADSYAEFLFDFGGL